MPLAECFPDSIRSRIVTRASPARGATRESPEPARSRPNRRWPNREAVLEHARLKDYLAKGRGFPSAQQNAAAGFWQEDAIAGYWANFPRFVVSLLKAWYGAAATAANEYGYASLPKNDDDFSQLAT